jgi:hypothetical protein
MFLKCCLATMAITVFERWGLLVSYNRTVRGMTVTKSICPMTPVEMFVELLCLSVR